MDPSHKLTTQSVSASLLLILTMTWSKMPWQSSWSQLEILLESSRALFVITIGRGKPRFSLIFSGDPMTNATTHLPTILSGSTYCIADYYCSSGTNYLTKATATDPSREYFGLSPLSLYSQYLTYMGHPLSPRFSAANLTGTGRQKLFRAFLRYELLCKMCCSDNPGDSSWYYELSSLWKYKGQTFQLVEAEAIVCVRSYVESLHKAITIQCEAYDEEGDVADELFSELSCFGFDLATALLQAVTAGKQGRNRVQMWLHDLCERKQEDLRISSDMDCKDCILGFDPLCEKDKHYTEGPGMYKMLYPIGLSSSMQRYLYRRKTWAFLDDVRLHPARLQQLCFTDADYRSFVPLVSHIILRPQLLFQDPFFLVSEFLYEY
ncbi:hypothetical protein E0Z10_g8412 [Xylaria hypoxylon]|uniref:Uncharacterized protein n=1 Tax=Xylaria hypoxylon TaxID=37992 RepID=A0A4Z0YMZ5_9PEZI|nr:hypothetical protein E0Z10_g8412 [Xylaria hypoxylon]